MSVNMIDVQSRHWVKPISGGISVPLLTELRRYLDNVQGERQALALSSREEKGLQLGLGTDALRKDPRWYEVWKEISSELLALIHPHTWVVFPVQVRLIQSENHLVPWHQDVGYQKILGESGHQQIITTWIPMNEYPSRHSTLQFALAELGELAHSPLHGHGAGLDCQEWPFVRHYDLASGDCLLFGDLTIHRTFVPERCSVSRQSLEFRLVRPEDAIPGKDYFSIEDQVFVRTDGTRRVFP
ncbi:hypothetical protein ACTRXD_21640 [Nitrospira sp. T9]|uniref:hypothetical protein n=1 Tax=unclassified Nitrospira TaxID=2652172 RepID=UPI003F9B8BA1